MFFGGERERREEGLTAMKRRKKGEPGLPLLLLRKNREKALD